MLLWRLGDGPLADWDEAIYAEVAREVGWSHQLTVLYWNYGPWFAKPPLLMWSTAALFHVFEVSPFWARMTTATAGFGTVLLTVAIGTRVHRFWTGLLAGVVMLCCYQFVYSSRVGTTDVLLTFFIYLAVYLYLRARAQPWWWVGVGGALGLAVMTKGAAGLVGAGGIGLVYLADSGLRPSALRQPHPWVGLATMFAVLLPWHLAAYRASGSTFISEYIGYNVLGRASNSIEGHTGGIGTYVALVRHEFFPWAYLAVVAWGLAAWRCWTAESRTWALPVISLVVFSAFTVISTKLPWYILPIYPALAIMIAALLVESLAGNGVAQVGLGAAILVSVASIPQSLPPYPAALRLLGAVAVVGVAVLSRTSRRSLAGPAMAATALAFCGLVSWNYIAAVFGSSKPYIISPVYSGIIPVSLAAQRETFGPADPLPIFIGAGGHMLDTPVWPDVSFYSHRRVIELRSAADLDTYVHVNRRTDLLVADSDRAGLEARYSVKVVSSDGAYDYVSLSLR